MPPSQGPLRPSVPGHNRPHQPHYAGSTSSPAPGPPYWCSARWHTGAFSRANHDARNPARAGGDPGSRRSLTWRGRDSGRVPTCTASGLVAAFDSSQRRDAGRRAQAAQVKDARRDPRTRAAVTGDGGAHACKPSAPRPARHARRSRRRTRRTLGQTRVTNTGRPGPGSQTQSISKTSPYESSGSQPPLPVRRYADS